MYNKRYIIATKHTQKNINRTIYFPFSFLFSLVYNNNNNNMEELIQEFPSIVLETNERTKQRSIKCKQPIKNKEMIFRSKLAACTIHRK